MTKLNQRSKRTAAVVTALIVLAFVCRVLGNNGFYPRAMGLVRSIIYIFLFAVWGFSLQRRIIQNWQRRYMAAIAICMSLWFSLRTLKYHFIPAATMPGVARLAWYAYYIPMLLIPMLALFTAVSLGKPEHYRPPHFLHLLWIPTVLLVLTVLTNDLHQTVFVFPQEYPIWTDAHYVYGPMYWVVMLGQPLSFLSQSIFFQTFADRIIVPVIINIDRHELTSPAGLVGLIIQIDPSDRSFGAVGICQVLTLLRDKFVKLSTHDCISFLISAPHYSGQSHAE